MADGKVQPQTAPRKNSDLLVRLVSAIVMLAVVSVELWLGGLWFDGLVALVGLATFYEFARLIMALNLTSLGRAAALVAGAIYIGAAAFFLIQIDNLNVLLLIIGLVILIDTFAYFFGRTIGGPKIAPSISPNKTWAGLLGGVIGATIALNVFWRYGYVFTYIPPWEMLVQIIPGFALAVLAQAGDFFESWLKRKAGRKDSSSLIPGHGGIFDRVDGLLPVSIAIGGLLYFQFPHWLDA